MKTSMTPVPLPPAACDALPGLCRRFHVRRLELFGSFVKDRFDPIRSDLDFLVSFHDLPLGGYADSYFGLKEALTDLFGLDIDLVTEPSLKNPYFRRAVEAEKRQVFPD